MLSARRTARESGATHYRGAPCRNCAGVLRYVKSGACHACAGSPRYRAADHSDKSRARRAAYKRAHPDKRNEERKRYRERHAVRLAEERKARDAAARAIRQALRRITNQLRKASDAIDKATKRVNRETDTINRSRIDKRARAALARQYRKATEPERYRESRRKKRRARNDREKTQGRPPGRAERRALLAAQAFACAYCPATEQLELDHRYPVVLGGSGEPHNFQYLCRTCNNAKRDTPDLDYRIANLLPISAADVMADRIERYRL